ncbi:MAG: enoyl-CoA hydratase-related protein [Sporomusaceae bacterium]|nr:enoyl-CoA hydratase-related protein [Sporomusaceae bacterium]
MSEKNVLLTQDSGVATITLNRPAALNAFNRDLADEFAAALATVRRDERVRAVVLTGSGRAFCAGGDLSYLTSLSDPAAARAFIADAGAITASLMDMEKPVVAMVNGVAAGAGFNLALACDLVYCAESARFGQSFVKVGLVPDCGGMYLLPQVVGMHKAKELMFTAELIDAQTALRLGVVNQVVADGQLTATVAELAAKLAASAPLALALTKRVLNRGRGLPLEAVLELEADAQALCLQTADHREGVAAFKEKRVPRFTGK